MSGHYEKFETIQTLSAEGPFSRTAIYNALNSGALSGFKMGRRTLIGRAEWTRFLAESVTALVPYGPATKARVAANHRAAA
ncbi:hypothetical protein SAMN05519103_01771 [Rhizobiales bacterium GAS113]|nr:hypothetical protein SAMN05519103_01771 [Rhizobiales bacterium GAS113]